MSQWKRTREELAKLRRKPVKPPAEFKEKVEELRKRLKERKHDES